MCFSLSGATLYIWSASVRKKREKNHTKIHVNAKYAIVPFYTDGYDLKMWIRRRYSNPGR